MRIQDIIEARYYRSDYVGWANSIIHNKTHSRREAVKSVPLNDIEQLIKDFKKAYGVPFVSNKDSDGLYYYMWENRPAEGPHYNIIVWPHNGDLFVNMWARDPITDPEKSRMFEARHIGAELVHYDIVIQDDIITLFLDDDIYTFKKGTEIDGIVRNKIHRGGSYAEYLINGTSPMQTDRWTRPGAKEKIKRMAHEGLALAREFLAANKNNIDAQSNVDDPIFEAKLSNRMKLSDFQRGDRIIMTSRMRKGTERRAAEVRLINHNDLGLVTYAPDHRNKELLTSGQGSFNPENIGKKYYGLQHVEIIWRKPTRLREARYHRNSVFDEIKQHVFTSADEDYDLKVWKIPGDFHEIIHQLQETFNDPPDQIERDDQFAEWYYQFPSLEVVIIVTGPGQAGIRKNKTDEPETIVVEVEKYPQQ